MVRAAAAAFRLLLSGAGTGVNLNKEHWAQQRVLQKCCRYLPFPDGAGGRRTGPT